MIYGLSHETIIFEFIVIIFAIVIAYQFTVAYFGFVHPQKIDKIIAPVLMEEEDIKELAIKVHAKKKPRRWTRTTGKMPVTKGKKIDIKLNSGRVFVNVTPSTIRKDYWKKSKHKMYVYGWRYAEVGAT